MPFPIKLISLTQQKYNFRLVNVLWCQNSRLAFYNQQLKKNTRKKIEHDRLKMMISKNFCRSLFPFFNKLINPKIFWQISRRFFFHFQVPTLLQCQMRKSNYENIILIITVMKLCLLNFFDKCFENYDPSKKKKTMPIQRQQ